MSAGFTDQVVRGVRPLPIFDGGTEYVRLTASNGTNPVTPPNGQRAWALAKLYNTGAAQAASVSIYDVPPGGSLTGLSPVFGPITLAASAVINVQIPLVRDGFAIVASSPVGADVVLSYWS